VIELCMPWLDCEPVNLPVYGAALRSTLIPEPSEEC
jgi:hypothetical protein